MWAGLPGKKKRAEIQMRSGHRVGSSTPLEVACFKKVAKRIPTFLPLPAPHLQAPESGCRSEAAGDPS